MSISYSKAKSSLRAVPWLSLPALPHHLAPDIHIKDLWIDPGGDGEAHRFTKVQVLSPPRLGFLDVKREVASNCYIDVPMPYPQECRKVLSMGIPRRKYPMVRGLESSGVNKGQHVSLPQDVSEPLKWLMWIGTI